MEVILHIGAHRTGTTSLQAGLNGNRQLLREHGMTYWGPRAIRKGLFAGLFSAPSFSDSNEKIELASQSKQNILHRIETLAQSRQSKLLISDENILGSMKESLETAELYPDLFMRLTHFSSLFRNDCLRVGISIRQYESYWPSCIAQSIKAGYHAPTSSELEKICSQPRRWRDVILEVSEMFPNAKIHVWEFNSYVGKLAEQIRILTGLELDFQTAELEGRKHNASPNSAALRKIISDRGDEEAVRGFSESEDTYLPFSAHQIEYMRENYLSDIDWLLSGVNGGVTFYGNR